ncbi:Ankyrin-2 [Porphyridium purpureum]|uniref:Ankyrin-2 n=1 Tax=Porphyridium purpureum TaxID=35688 RepID=A0A5J4YW77_PORPP|nr:Ankyrin-2 [Porphyridium purpureum]|eukprot:POR5186..scf227_4
MEALMENDLEPVLLACAHDRLDEWFRSNIDASGLLHSAALLFTVKLAGSCETCVEVAIRAARLPDFHMHELSTALHVAANSSSCRVIELLIEKGIDPNSRNRVKTTALHVACARGRIEQAVLLLSKGADLDGLDSANYTPLHAAAACAQPEMVRLILDYGARTDIRTVSGLTAWDMGNTAVRTEFSRAVARRSRHVSAVLGINTNFRRAMSQLPTDGRSAPLKFT